MIISVPVTSVFTTNAYFFIDDSTRHGFLIDSGAGANTLLSVIKEKQLTIEKVLLTHGHFDHMVAAEKLQQILGIPICMHENGFEYAENPRWNLSESCGLNILLRDIDYLPDGSNITDTKNPMFSLKMCYAPGHTTDSVIYYNADDNVAFVGDSIFKNSFGLTHFYGGDARTLMKSVTERILTLPPDTVLLSGHSEPTTVQAERRRSWYTPYLYGVG